jgi:hypothetical protein
MLTHKISSEERIISDKALNREDFPRLVALNFNAKHADMADASGIQKLVPLKSAIKEVGERLENDSGRCL